MAELSSVKVRNINKLANALFVLSGFVFKAEQKLNLGSIVGTNSGILQKSQTLFCQSIMFSLWKDKNLEYLQKIKGSWKLKSRIDNGDISV